MIKLTTTGSSGLRSQYVAATNVARITDAGPNCHGIRSYVQLFTGQTLDCAETAVEINDLITEDARK